LRSKIGIRVPATALPIDEDDLEGPARRRLTKGVGWYWYGVIALVACALAWVLGGR
jgi:hypothetical protein